MSSDIYEIKVLKELVKYRSVSGNSEAYLGVADAISRALTDSGIKVNIHDAGKEAGDNVSRPIVIAELDTGSSLTLGVLTHYDVVDAGGAWSHDPFDLKIVEEDGDVRLYGRGAADDKGCVVAGISALRELVNEKDKLKWNIVFMAVPDEEIGGKYGAGYIARKNIVKLDALLVADSSSLGLTVGASGIIHGKIKIKGVQGHAGYILGTQNALQRAITFLEKLRSYTTIRSQKLSRLRNPPWFTLPKLWGRFSLTWIKTPNADQPIYNMVPGEVEVGFDMRLIPEEDVSRAEEELLTFLEMTKHETGIHDVELEILKKVKGWMTDPEHPYIREAHRKLERVTGRKMPIMGMLGGNDGSWFAGKVKIIFSYGVWDEKSKIHGINESASLKRIQDLKNYIKELAKMEIDQI